VSLPMSVDENGKSVRAGEAGISRNTPALAAMMRTIWNNDERYRKYWESIPGCYQWATLQSGTRTAISW